MTAEFVYMLFYSYLCFCLFFWYYSIRSIRKDNQIHLTFITRLQIIMTKRAAGFVIFRRLSGEIQYLLMRASYGDFHWSSPKGHVDPGEDDFTTALRETREEAGYNENDLKIHKEINSTLTYEVKGRPKIVVYWLAELKDPLKEPVLSEEHTEFKWLAKEEAKKTVGFADNQKLIDEFHKKIIDLN